MANCFDEIYAGTNCIIGIKDYKHCCNPASGLYINDVEGITLKVASAIAQEDFESGYAMANHIINKSIKIVNEDFKQFLLPYYNLNVVNEYVETGEFDITFNAIANLNRGVKIERVKSKLAKIKISQIQILVADSGNADIEITDGLKTTTINVDLIANEIYYLYPNLTCNHHEVYVKINNATFRTAKKETDFDVSGCFGDCGCSCNTGNNNIWINGWNGTEEVNEMFGVNVIATLECSLEEFICPIIDKMYYLYFLKSGIEFCKEKEATNRLNDITIFSKEISKQIRERLTEEYKEKFDVFCKNIIPYINNFQDLCITCNKNKYVQSTP